MYAARNGLARCAYGLGALRVRIGYAARIGEGALRAEIWENLIRKSEKIQVESSITTIPKP